MNRHGVAEVEKLGKLSIAGVVPADSSRSNSFGVGSYDDWNYFLIDNQVISTLCLR